MPINHDIKIPVNSSETYAFGWANPVTSEMIDLTGDVIEAYVLTGDNTKLFDFVITRANEADGQFELNVPAALTKTNVPFAMKQARYVIRLDDVRIVEGKVTFDHE